MASGIIFITAQNQTILKTAKIPDKFCTVELLAVRLDHAQLLTRELCYRKDDRAMRAM